MVHFKVNGHAQTFDGDPEMPLLWYLRDILGLTGTKFGCGMALCGACTVLQNGKAIRSCQKQMSTVEGLEITTIEGISASGSHAVQKAWAEVNVPQCGYCQPGQIMSGAALLAKTPHPTDDQIESAMVGNLCRCGMYQRIRSAIHRASRSGASGSAAGKGA